MRKIFTLFAALLVVLAVNAAAKTNIIAGTNTLHTALYNANAGDTIVLADGTYVENKDGANNYISFSKNVVVMAAEGAKPVIDMYVAMCIKSGALVEIKGLKFDATHVMESNISWANHMLYAEDNANNRVIFDGCEFYNDTVDAASISCGSSEKIDSLVIKNCYFHDIRKCVLSLNNADAKVSISNTTFSKISNTGSSWYAPINLPAATGKLRVDNCTFYDVLYMGNVYGSIYAPNLTDAILSNSVFQLSTSEECYIVYFPEGAKVRNCVTYNYENWAPFCRGNYATITACAKGDPKFADAANGKFTLTAGSRALDYVGKAADNTTDSVMNLGDPRWVPQPKTIYCEMTQGWWTDADAAVGCYAWNGSDANKVENAAWPGVRMTSLGEGVWSYDVSAKYDNVIFTRVNPTGDIADWGFKSYDLAIPAQWDYYTLTTSSKSEAEAAGNKSAGTWTKLNPTLENGWYLIGTFGGEDAWTFETLTAEKKFAVNPENAEEFIVTAALAAGDEFKAAYVYYDQINDIKPAGTGNNYVVDADHAGANKSIYFRQDYYDSWGGHFYVPETVPEAIYHDFEIDMQTDIFDGGSQKYLFIDGEGVYHYSDAAPAEYNAYFDVLNGNRFSAGHGYQQLAVTVPVVAGDYKVTLGKCQYAYSADYTTAYVKTIDGTQTLTQCEQNTVSGAEGGVCYHQDTEHNIATMEFTVDANQMVKIFCAHYTPYIKMEKIPNPTAIDNTVVSEKTVKFFRDGQLYIEKDGKIYNVLGVEIK